MHWQTHSGHLKSGGRVHVKSEGIMHSWRGGHFSGGTFGNSNIHSSHSHFGQKSDLFPNKYPNMAPEKFLLLIITYQGNIKIKIIKILYIPTKPGKGMDRSPL